MALNDIILMEAGFLKLTIHIARVYEGVTIKPLSNI
jgi:hypothetical protein